MPSISLVRFWGKLFLRSRCFCLLWTCLPLSVLAEKAATLSVLSVDYESGQSQLPGERVGVVLPPASDAIRTDCTQARSGRCSLLTRVLPTPDYRSQGAWRAESNAMESLSVRYGPGDHFLYRFSLKLADDWDLRPPAPGAPRPVDIVWQFKRFDGPPDMFVAVKAGALVVRVGQKAQLTLLPAPLPAGRWIDLAFDVRWAADQRGTVDVTAQVQGQPSVRTVRHVGPNLRNARPQAGYLKWGLYLPDAQPGFASRTLWHDAIEVYRLGGN